MCLGAAGLGDGVCVSGCPLVWLFLCMGEHNAPQLALNCLFKGFNVFIVVELVTLNCGFET